MELRLFKLQFIFHNYSSPKTLLIKIFLFATLMALIPSLDLIYPIDGCDHFHSWTLEKSNLPMNISELNPAFQYLLAGKWLNNSYKTLTIGRESIRAVMVLKKLGFRDVIGVDRNSCSYMKVKRGSIYHLPLEENSFDFVFSMSMIDGVRVPARMVLEMERVLKSGRIGVVLRPVSGRVPVRDVMKVAAPVASYLKYSDVVGVCTVNRTVMVLFRKRKRFIGGDDGELERERLSSSSLPG